MPSFNSVTLVGNLASDPEIRYVQSGSAVCKFRLAVNPTKRDPKPEDTLFINIVAWERLAETCNTYLSKGKPCLVQGRLEVRNYENNEGEKKTAVEVVINTMQLLGDRRSDDHDTGAQAPRSGSGSRVSDELEDEIPF